MSESPDNCHSTPSADPAQPVFNLDAPQYVPKQLLNYVKDVEDYEEEIQEEIDEMIGQEIEKEVMNELQKYRFIEDDDESEDEDKWIPDYKDCHCCHGFVYNCKDKTCSAMGQCFCKMKDDIDRDEKKCDSKGNVNSDNNNKAVIMTN